jgi:uracil-DNA glycosylase family 4
MGFLSEGKLISEFTSRARAAQLDVRCVGAGKTNSKLVIIGEAIGDKEESMRVPFVGATGQVLWRHLGEIGVKRKDAYCTNVIKRQVSTSVDTDKRVGIPRPELEHWEALLEWELDQLEDPKYILILGNQALKAVIGEWGITNWRGSVTDAVVGRLRRPVKVICTFNPAHVYRNNQWENIFRFDIYKLKMVMGGSWSEYRINPYINPSPSEAIAYIDKIHEERLPISIDIETMAGETACIGLTNNPHSGMCINFREARSNRFTTQEEREVRRKIQDLFSDRECRFVAQNGNFDSYWLWYKDRIRVHKIWFDTLLAHHTLYPRMYHNLGFLTSQYTTHPYYKDEAKTWREGGDINQFWEYNVKDICLTLYIQQKLLKELREQGLEDFFFNHVMRLNPHLVEMTVTGVLVDQKLKEQIAEDIGEEVNKKREEFQHLARQLDAKRSSSGNDKLHPINPDSSKQVKELYFDRLKLVGRGRSTDEANRRRIIENPTTTPRCITLVKLHSEYKKVKKFHSTYATSGVDEDNRFRCEWKQYGTQKAPGRLSSGHNMWGTAQNLQNQPQQAYPMFRADDGYMFSYFDLSQAEARIVAYQWRVQALIENFERAASEGIDVHRANASRIFQVSYEDIPTIDRDEAGSPTTRFLGKKCVHGLNYRMAPLRLAEECGIPLSQGYEAYTAYHRAFPEIRAAWDDTIRRVRTEKMLFTPLGRRMIFMERLDEHSMDSVIAFVPQSTVGDKVASVIYLCHEDPNWPSGEARILINVHDALIAMHKPEHLEVVQSTMQKYAEEPIIIHGEPVVIPAELKSSVPDKDGVHRWSTIGESLELSAEND